MESVLCQRGHRFYGYTINGTKNIDDYINVFGKSGAARFPGFTWH